MSYKKHSPFIGCNRPPQTIFRTMETLSYELLCYIVQFIRNQATAVALSAVNHQLRAAVTSTWGLANELHIHGGSRAVYNMQSVWTMRRIEISGVIGPTTSVLPFTQLREVKFNSVHVPNKSHATLWLLHLLRQAPVLDIIKFKSLKLKKNAGEFELFVRGLSGVCKAKHVHFVGFDHIDGINIVSLTRYTCHLQSLTISHSGSFFDTSAAYIIRRNCDTLTHIDMAKNKHLTNKLFDSIALCRRLKTLDLHSCDLLTDEGAVKLLQCPLLETIDLYNNHDIGEDTFCMLVTQFPYLRGVFFSDWNGPLGKRAAIAAMTNSNLRDISVDLAVCRKPEHANWFSDWKAYIFKQMRTYPTGDFCRVSSSPCKPRMCDACDDYYLK